MVTKARAGAPHLVLVTHQRSGSHLTIDLVRNNIPSYAAPYISFKDVRTRQEPNYFLRLAPRLTRAPRIFKSHATAPLLAYYSTGARPLHIGVLGAVLQGARLIHVYRDGRDVLVSLFRHYQHFSLIAPTTTFYSFLRGQFDTQRLPHLHGTSPVHYWAAFVAGWFRQADPNLLHMPYGLLLTQPIVALERIAAHTSSPRSAAFVDMRLRPGDAFTRSNATVTAGPRPVHTAVGLLDDHHGAYQKWFTPDDLALFASISAVLLFGTPLQHDGA